MRAGYHYSVEIVFKKRYASSNARYVLTHQSSSHTNIQLTSTNLSISDILYIHLAYLIISTCSGVIAGEGRVSLLYKRSLLKAEITDCCPPAEQKTGRVRRSQRNKKSKRSSKKRRDGSSGNRKKRELQAMPVDTFIVDHLFSFGPGEGSSSVQHLSGKIRN